MHSLENSKEDWKKFEREIKLGYCVTLGVTFRSMSVKLRDNGYLMTIRVIANQEPLVVFMNIGTIDQLPHAFKEALERATEIGKPDKYWDNP